MSGVGRHADSMQPFANLEVRSQHQVLAPWVKRRRLYQTLTIWIACGSAARVHLDQPGPSGSTDQTVVMISVLFLSLLDWLLP